MLKATLLPRKKRTASTNLRFGSLRIPYLDILFACLIIATTFWGYYDILDDFFIMDDFHMIQGHSTFGQFLKHWHSPVGANSYRPLIDLLFIWDFYWSGWNPLGWHLSDLIFHIINSLLVYSLAKRLTRSPYVGMVAGILFGLHTSHTEAVTWISARMDVVCATFFLLSILYFVSSTAAQGHFMYKKKRKRAYILSLVCFTCALLVKEMAISLPLIVILYDLTFCTGWNGIKFPLWKKAKLYAPYFVLLAGYFVIRFSVLYGASGYDSKLRSGLGGYNFSLFGTFIFDNLVHYFKFLVIPFERQIFSHSLILNVVGIAIFTFICVIISKESCFATLWIFINLLPVLPITLGRGVYQASVGFCILMGIILVRTLRETCIVQDYRHRTKSVLKITLLIFQIIIISALFYKYGIALKISNVWWSNVAHINETVPLLVKAIHPTFPEDSKICLQNVPLVFNQRFNPAFEFRYPDTQIGGVYVKKFDEYIEEKGQERILETYFFHYDRKDIYDLTYETRERLMAGNILEVQKVYRQPDHILSAKSPQLEFELTRMESCASIGLVTSLANGIEAFQGTVIAHGRIEGINGAVETFEIIAGQDTAEWAIRFPHVQEMLQHEIPQPYRVWTVQQPDNSINVAQNYIKQIKFQRPFTPVKVSLEFVSSPDMPPNVMLDINRLIFYGEKETGVEKMNQRLPKPRRGAINTVDLRDRADLRGTSTPLSVTRMETYRARLQV